LTSAAAELETMYGSLRSSWELADDEFRLDVTIPPNTAATVVLPSDDTGQVTESGRSLADAGGINGTRTEGSATIVEIGSGTYHFVCRYH
jgi:alpha-L-rhamnosidase